GSPGCPVDHSRGYSPRDGCRALHGHHRHHCQPARRPRERLAQPQGACLMSEPVEIKASTATLARTNVFKRNLKNTLGVFAVAVLTIMVLVAIFAGWIAPFGENAANIGKTLAGADSVNLLGTDSAGRDTFSRLVFGAQTTLLSALLCAAVAIAIGLPAGLIAG